MAQLSTVPVFGKDLITITKRNGQWAVVFDGSGLTVPFTSISGSVAASQMPALTGDITQTGSLATTIADNAVSNAAGSGRIAALTAVPAGGNNAYGLKFSTTPNLGTFFGQGAPTLAAAKGSQYLRTDGSGTNNRMYINTDGGSTWTAVATVA